MSRNPDSRSRGDDGNCSWEYAEPYLKERQKLEEERNPFDPDDPTPWEVDALALIDAIMAAAEGDGFDPDDYAAPMGRDVTQENPPWIGEIKSSGVPRKDEGGSREYRVYFAEPLVDRVLLAALLKYKTAKQMRASTRFAAKPLSSGRQTSDIATAMGIVRGWCNKCGVSYRPRG
ncbi:hypothetical protein JTZ10_11000 [Gordonia rubripertincta]|uniref:Uncharacterized protein n=1 Tax=Gordonia rubripertincta TaxID=36822 RepID=A0AAW4G4I6_GORRU|nr:hypothetical protein [Gordonia rubripertincta]MBM7278290.1 hypothetical protein [Gordonia rubripertincta]